MRGRADGWIGWTTTGCGTLLAVIAGTVSYLHMRQLVAEYGQPGWVAALTPLSVDGMIVAASTPVLADSRSGGRGGLLSWALLVIGSVASLAANVAVAEPSAAGRVIAAWPSFALIGSYELLMRQIRSAAGSSRSSNPAARNRRVAGDATSASPRSSSRPRRAAPRVTGSRAGANRELQLQAWQWAQANQASDGSLPSGKAIAGQYGRHERWGRLVTGWTGRTHPGPDRPGGGADGNPARADPPGQRVGHGAAARMAAHRRGGTRRPVPLQNPSHGG